MALIDTLFEADEARIPLKHPITGNDLFDVVDGEKKPVVMVCYGLASDQYREIENARTNRLLRPSKVKETAADIEKRALDDLCKLVKRIEVLTYRGQALDNPTTLREFFADRNYRLMREQADREIANPSNFMSDSAN